MNKIILSLIFVFIALMGVACVSACDCDACNCTACDCDACNCSAYDGQQVDLENIDAADDSQQNLENNNSSQNPDDNGRKIYYVDNISVNYTVFSTGNRTCDSLIEDGGIIIDSNELENTTGFFKKIKRLFKSFVNFNKDVSNKIDDKITDIVEFEDPDTCKYHLEYELIHTEYRCGYKVRVVDESGKPVSHCALRAGYIYKDAHVTQTCFDDYDYNTYYTDKNGYYTYLKPGKDGKRVWMEIHIQGNFNDDASVWLCWGW